MSNPNKQPLTAAEIKSIKEKAVVKEKQLNNGKEIKK